MLNSPESLSKHEITHEVNRPTYNCPTCFKEFYGTRKLRKHILLHALDGKHECQTCEKVFLKKSILDKHKLYHAGTRPYMCDICFLAFKVKHNLEIHIRTHSLVKNASCKLCLKKFKRETSLGYHIDIVHGGNKKFNCPDCKIICTTAQSLLGHKKVCASTLK